MLDTIIKNGTVVNADSIADIDIGIKNGEIVQIGKVEYFPEVANVIDAAGMEVYPGMIDSHVHINFKLGEFSTLDSFKQASMAAAYGGTTSMIEFAIPYEGETPLDALERRKAEASKNTFIDYSFHGAFTEANIHDLDQVETLIKEGIPSIKMFTVYDNLVRINKGAIYDILKEIQKYSGLALFHAENNDMITRNIQQRIEDRQLTPVFHAKSRPPISEAEEVAGLLALLEDTEAPGLFVHMSTGKVRELLHYYRQTKRLPVFTEVCTHYLSLEEEVYERSNGQLFVCSPPIRKQEEREALWEMMDAGLIDLVNSDHCCYNTVQKDKYADYFPKAPNGLPGIETRGIVLYSDGVQTGRMDRQDFAAATSARTAKIMGMPKKGKIAIGYDADIAVIDPKAVQLVSAEELHMTTDYTPFEGKTVQGKVVHTLVRGYHLLADGEWKETDCHGAFIKRTGPTF